MPHASDLFQAIERGTTLANRVTRQMEYLIVEGHLKPGDRLPAERELAQQFGVSRTVVREAVRALVAKGLLAVRPGSGTVVSSPTKDAVSQSMSLLLRTAQFEIDYDKVHEIRRILEVEIAALAAQRRTPQDLERMEEILRQASEIVEDRNCFAECDVAFHAALARATHNELFPILLDSVVDIMLKVREMGFSVPGTPGRAFRYHQAILEQIKAGNPERARQAMREHLIESEDTMRRALTLLVDSVGEDGAQS
jgi:GntR family transcriptional repressor for pyruvate dehydrogenase complex